MCAKWLWAGPIFVLLGGCSELLGFDEYKPGSSGSGGTSSGTGGAGAGGGEMTTSTEGTSGGGAAATGGSGGSGAGGPIGGDVCPGVQISLDVYGRVIVGGDSTQAKDNYGTAVCGGASSPDLVYAVNAKADGFLEANLTADAPYMGFVYVRADCDQDPAFECSDSTVRVPVAKGKVYYVVVDGHPPYPSGTFKLDLFLDGCGNGIIDGDGADAEECDDSNALDNDTCMKCKVRCTKDGAMTNDADLFLDPVTHHCYLQSYPDVSWEQARQNCIAWGGTLAGLSTQAEIEALDNLLDNNFGHCWTGGTDEDTEGVFSWINGEEWIFANGSGPWADGVEPNGATNENCVEIFSDGRISDENCNTELNSLCERAPAGAAQIE